MGTEGDSRQDDGRRSLIVWPYTAAFLNASTTHGTFPEFHHFIMISVPDPARV